MEEVAAVKGHGHKGLVVDLVQTQEGGFVSTGFDDVVKSLTKDEFSCVSPRSLSMWSVRREFGPLTLARSCPVRSSSTLPTSSQPKALASAAPSSPALLLAASSSASLLSSSSGSVSSTTELALPSASSSASLLAAALSPSGTLAALSTDDAKLHLFSTSGSHERTIELRANATALAFGRGKSGQEVLAVGLQTGKVPLYDPASGDLVQNRWADISARVTALAFDPLEGKKLAAASLDESVRVYDVDAPSTVLSVKNLCVALSLFASGTRPSLRLSPYERSTG